MSHPEIGIVILLLAIAAVVVGVDAWVRLVISPRRRDRFVGELLDHLMEPENEGEANPPRPAAAVGSDLQESLLRHFEHSATSRQILSSLASRGGLTHPALLASINRRLAERERPPLPAVVARRVAGSLIDSGLVKVENGVMNVTALGQRLDALLREREGTPGTNPPKTPKGA